MHNYERLQVWHRAHDLTIEICQALARARIRRHRTLVHQLERAIISVPANIAEGAGQATNPQFARFLTIAIASVNESASHLALMDSLQMISRKECDRWRAELVSIRRMMYGLQKNLRSPDSKTRENPEV